MDHLIFLKTKRKKRNNKLLFTEFTYRNINFSDKELWNEEWFAGGYLWKWFIDHEKVGGFENHMFTPQNKPVESVVRANYSIVH